MMLKNHWKSLRHWGGDKIKGTGVEELLDAMSANAGRFLNAKDKIDKLTKTIKLVETLKNLETGENFDGEATVKALGEIIEFAADLMGEIPPPFGTIAVPMLKAYSEAIKNAAGHIGAIQAATNVKNAIIAEVGGKTPPVDKPDDVDDSFEWNVYPYPWCPECETEWWSAGNSKARADNAEWRYGKIKKRVNELEDRYNKKRDKMVKEGYRLKTAEKEARTQTVLHGGEKTTLGNALDELYPERDRREDEFEDAKNHAAKMQEYFIDCLEDCVKNTRAKYGYRGWVPGYSPQTQMGYNVSYDSSVWCEYDGGTTHVPYEPDIECPDPGSTPEEPQDPTAPTGTPESPVTPTTPKTPEITGTPKTPNTPITSTPETPITTKPPPQKPKEPPLTTYKVARSVLNTAGKIVLSAMHGARVKVNLFDPPPLPIAGTSKPSEKQEDSQGHGDPMTGHTNKDGKITLGKDKLTEKERSALSMLAAGSVVSDAFPMAEAEAMKLAEFYGPEQLVQIIIPKFKSYIVKLKIDRSLKLWKDPVAYMRNKQLKSYVVQHWIVQENMYVVLNFPVVEEK